MNAEKEVLLLGGGGLLGSRIANRLARLKVNHVATRSRDVDLLDSARLGDFFAGRRTKTLCIILNAGLMPYAALPHDSPDVMLGNAQMAANVLAATTRNRVSEILFVSTIDVYGKPNALISEATRPQPQSNYGIAKYASELMLEQGAFERSIRFLNFRVTHLFGPNDTSSKLIPSLIRSALADRRMRLTGGGRVRRDFLYADDAARIIVEGVGNGASGTFNLVSGKSRTCIETAESIKRIIERLSPGSAGPRAIELEVLEGGPAA